jgi:LmbE family N-acetylglucosaminyl deacetylase
MKPMPHPPLVCISPHPDDAALSCGGLLAYQAGQGRPALVVTVFAGDPPPAEELTPFAQELHHEWGDMPNPMQQRRAEDAEAVAALGCAGQTWDYRDALYRHPAYGSREALFGPPAEEASLEKELLDRCAALAGGCYLLPLAVGRHVDHQLLFRVGWRLHETGAAVAFYEDVPYVAWAGGPAARLAELGRPLWPYRFTATPTWPAKMAAIACYPSQFASLEHDGVPLLAAVEHYAAALAPSGYVERIWSHAGAAFGSAGAPDHRS